MSSVLLTLSELRVSSAIFRFGDIHTTYFLATFSADKISDMCVLANVTRLLMISVFCAILHLAP